MDITPSSEFEYENEDAWHDFLLLNSLSHSNYNGALALTGVEIPSFPISSVDKTKEALDDWLQNHNFEHQRLSDALGITDAPDLSDVNLHDKDQFYNWLQLHAQQHQLIDAVLNV